MPTWILLIEYLPLFALLAAGFILREYAKRQKISDMKSNHKKEEMEGVQE